MFFSSKIRLLFCFSIFIVFSTILGVSAACLDSPTFIKVNSGEYDLGDFTMFDLDSPIYIKNNFVEHNLKIDFYFSGAQKDCYNKSDVMLKLFETGASMPAHSIDAGEENVIASFVFTTDLDIESAFSSSFVITHKDNDVGTSGGINFDVDDDIPLITVTADKTGVVQKNTTINVDYEISDLKSGLKSLKISNTDVDIEFEDNSSYSGSFSEKIKSSKVFKFIVEDRLGNVATYNLSYKVDSSAPVLSDFKNTGYYRESDGTRRTSYRINIKDATYIDESVVPEIYGDFSALNDDEEEMVPVCDLLDTQENTYSCLFRNILIDNIDETKTVDIAFRAVDNLGNEVKKNFSTEVFYDSKGPDILDFYLINSMGEKNIFSAFDANTKVVVNFNDESAIRFSDVRFIPEFDGLEMFLTYDCENSSISQFSCYYELSETVAKYAGVETDEITFKITLVDMYGNPASEKINITVNNNRPVITQINLVETTDIKDSIVNSGEKVNFELFLTDDNLKFEDEFIYGDFSSVDFRDGMDNKTANCNYYNETLVQCDFTGIVLENGYLKRNVTFYVADTAGNRVRESFEVEVLAVGDEVFASYKIPKILITNVLDTYVVKNAGQDGWFEGILELQSGNDDIKLVNYQIKDCNDSMLDPILLGERTLYPEKVVVKDEENEQADDNFIFKVEIQPHDNDADFEEKILKCTMSVLKRDDTTVYPPELVDFELDFRFYTLPGETIVKAEAQKVLEMAKGADFLGSWFDSFMSIYNIFSGICSTLNSGLSVIGTLNSATTHFRAALYPTPAVGVAKSMDDVLMTAHGLLSGLSFDSISPIKMMCDFVTCANGGLWGDMVAAGGGANGGFAGDMMDTYNEFNEFAYQYEAICVDSEESDD